MFESLVTEVLKRFLGDYVDGLNKAQLSIAVWNGDVELENLSLKKNALKALDLPINVLHGYLGKLTLKIPWKKLKSEPVLVSIDNLFIVASPKEDFTFDPAETERRLQKAKQKKLTHLEEK
eukprot:Opistho-2@65866